VTEAYSEYFLLGIPRMKNLVKFSLKYDCTENVLQVLSETVGETLKYLDVEQSMQVMGSSTQYILKFSNLEELGIYRTSLGEESQAQILVGMKNLKHLRRGDFLCDVLEYIHDHHSALNFRLKLQEFWQAKCVCS
jgi:hypothetical protein